MIAFAWIVMMAASTNVDLVDEVYRIPASEWRYVEVDLNQKAAMVRAHFQVQSPSAKVRLALMRREDLERLREGLPHGVIDETDAAASGSLAPAVHGPGHYVVVVDNRSDRPTEVRLRVSLDFSGRFGPEVTRLSPRRQLTVILISFAVFFGIVTLSARRLLRGIRR